MTLIQDYPTNVGVSYGDFVRNLFRPLAPAAMLAHAAMGVVTEVQELRDAKTLDNAIEEAGDIVFFCAALRQVLPHQVDAEQLQGAQRAAFLDYCNAAGFLAPEFDNENVPNFLMDSAITMLDVAKRYLAYDKAPDESTCLTLHALAELVGGMAMQVSNPADEAGEPDPQGVIDVNVAKLQHRYKGGFSVEAAVNRDVASELEVIQGAVAS